MTLRVEYQELVDTDLLDAWTWYEDQQTGLGDRLLDEVSATVERLSRSPNIGTPVLHDDDGRIIERKVRTNGFPYTVRYRILGDRLVIMAIRAVRSRRTAADRATGSDARWPRASPRR